MLSRPEAGQPAATAGGVCGIYPAGASLQPSGGIHPSGICMTGVISALPAVHQRESLQLRGGWRRCRRGALPEYACWHPLIWSGRMQRIVSHTERRCHSQGKKGEPTDCKCLWKGQAKPRKREPAEWCQPTVVVDGQGLVREGLDKGKRHAGANLRRETRRLRRGIGAFNFPQRRQLGWWALGQALGIAPLA